MGRQALISALCWVIQGTLAVNLVLNDNLSANNVKRLYRNVATNGAIPYGMYRYGMTVSPYGANAYGTARAHPYGAVGAYTYHVPYVMSPKAPAQSQAIPAVSNAKFVQDTSNLYLKDSYGNKYVQSPNTLPLKPLTPQQFLQLQALPQHLVQPLTATPFNFNYKQAPGTQQIVYGSQYRPVQQTTTGAHYVYEQAHPGGNSQPVKTFADYAPSNFHPHPGASADQAIKSFAEYAPSYFQTHFGVSNDFWKQYAPQSQQSSALTYEPPTPTYTSSAEPEESLAVVPVQQQSTSNNKQVYSVSTISPPSFTYSSHTPLQYTYTTPKPKKYTDSEEIYDEEKRDAVRTVKAKLRKQNANVASVKTTVNGKKAIVNIETNPTLPLLDITLLEPLTFNNPILPQVQHYLPRIHDANYVKLSDVKPKEKKYQKEYVIEKSKQYDTGYVKSKAPKNRKEPKKTAPKRKSPSVEIITFDDEIAQASTARPQVIVKEETPKKIPEISVKINTPGYKEIYSEKAVSYNKETNSEPVHYTYGSHKHDEPTHYSYSHSSKEPLHIKSIQYEGHGEVPKGKNSVAHKELPKQVDHPGESETSSEENDGSYYSEELNEHGKKSPHLKPEHREKEYHHHSSRPSSNEQDYSQFFSEDSGFHPVAQIEEEIHVAKPEIFEKEHEQNQPLVVKKETQSQHQNDHYHHQTHYQNKPQHIKSHYQPQQKPQKEYNHQLQQQPQKEYHHQPQLQHKDHHYEPQHKEHHYETQPQQKEQHYAPQLKEHHYEPQTQHKEHQYQPIQTEHHKPLVQQLSSLPQQAPQTQNHPVHFQEKTKKVYIQEETPVEDESLKDTPIEHEAESEQDFEKAYKDAAFGFPAYESHPENSEKDIFNPGNYGIPRQSSDYKAELSPFQQYFEQGDNFPKVTRHNYLDTRDKTKDNYFLDFSINQPQFMADRYTKKVDYLKNFQKHKPENHFGKTDGKKQEKQSENYATIPYDYYTTKGTPKLAFAQMTTIPREFDYSKFKGEKKDNYAFASKPLYAYKLNTHFVEPQYEYGFDPVGLPRLLDSELASMATNINPASEKPGMRKQIYKENFYIKKTTLSDGANS